MLPLYLSIEGLYSYQKKQEIDFTRLTEAGLFGIFGKVGSGKSSILEAISFVLYGETERLNKQEKRAYNMLNLRSDVANIVFDFLNYEERKFRFTAQWKRRKRFEETSSLERSAYEWIDDAWFPLASNDGALVTGLSYANFRRTIIIPQGQFKEFLELKGKERSDMMRDLFNLDRFDLGPKVAQLQRQNNSHLERLNGALAGLETVNATSLEEKQRERDFAHQHFVSIKAETSLLDQEISILKESKKVREELAKKKEEEASYHLEAPRIAQLEKELQIYEKTHLVFREILTTTQHLNKEKEQLIYKIEQLSTRKSDVLRRLEKEEQEWETIAPDYQRIDTFKTSSHELGLLATIAQNKRQQETLQQRIQSGKPHLFQVLEEEKRISDQIEAEEKQLEELKSIQIDTSVLLALETWYQTDDNNTNKINELAAQIRELETEISQAAAIFHEQSLTITEWEPTILQREADLNKALTVLQHEETVLQVEAKLSEFANNLSHGQACPLCGSLEHPNPMKHNHISKGLQAIFQQQNELKTNLQELKINHHSLTAASVRWREKNKQRARLMETFTDIQGKKEAHISQFRWKGFSPTDRTAFLVFKEKNQLAEARIKSGESFLKELRTQWQSCQTRIEKYKSSLVEFEQKIQVLDQLNTHNKMQIRELNSADYEQQDEKTILEKKREKEIKIKFLEREQQRLSESIQKLRTDFARVNGEHTAAMDQSQQLYQQLNGKQAELAALLKKHKYDDINQVQNILQKNMDVAGIRKKVQEFYVSHQILLRHITDIEKRIVDDAYDDAVFLEKTARYASKREELESQIRITGALEKEYARLRVDFEKKEKLLATYEQLSLRKSNLTMLENLFRGSGFVNYVSSIHLQHLCENANQRFHRLTKNNLSLAVNENNEFEIVDFLNNGHRRSVKTLSGGQAFQASLCLALALAENIQSMSKTNKNFFFIDEGFGTQDSESMNTVFETLQYLNRHHRIVGIISHVEELKERIPRAITVINDPEKGSLLEHH